MTFIDTPPPGRPRPALRLAFTAAVLATGISPAASPTIHSTGATTRAAAPLINRLLPAHPTNSALGSLMTPASTLNICNFKLTYDEEFQNLAIAAHTLTGSARWTAHTPWNGDFGQAAFSDPSSSNLPFALAPGGGLKITAWKDSSGNWHSGLIAAADATGHGWGLQHGYFETRMNMAPGPGTWQGFWLMSLKPAADPRPNVEIDVAEYFGQMTDRYYSSLHVWYKGSAASQSRTTSTMVPATANSLVGQFHTYGVRVESDYITYYVDRVAVWQQATPAELTTPLYPLVDLGLGGGWPITGTPSPTTMTTSYVRVYADSPSPTC